MNMLSILLELPQEWLDKANKKNNAHIVWRGKRFTIVLEAYPRGEDICVTVYLRSSQDAFLQEHSVTTERLVEILEQYLS